LIGQAFQARVAASLLQAIELPELITYTQDEYEKLAIDLATNHDKFNKLKEKLLVNKLSTQLFNTQLFTNNIEKAFNIIFKRYVSNLPIENIYID